MTERALCEAISSRLSAAARSGVPARILDVFADDATIWHNITGRTCTAAQAAAMFSAMVQAVKDIRYEDVRVTPTADGYVQQHRLCGKIGEKELGVSACIVCRVRGQQIAALDEYLDSGALARAGLALGA